MLAPMFVTGGLDALRHPESKESKAAALTGPITETLGLPDETPMLVRVNGGVAPSAEPAHVKRLRVIVMVAVELG